MNAKQIAEIIELAAQGMTAEQIAEDLYQSACDSAAADWEDDSDSAIERRYGISRDDRFDSRGEALLPAVNDAGEPWWM